MVSSMIKSLTVLIILSLLSACASNSGSQSVYQQLGGQQKVDEIVQNFVTEIEYDPVILAYFEGVDIDRFIEKLSE